MRKNKKKFPQTILYQKPYIYILFFCVATSGYKRIVASIEFIVILNT
jgi:hypothetical protein